MLNIAGCWLLMEPVQIEDVVSCSASMHIQCAGKAMHTGIINESMHTGIV